jgi:hypothetical protein
LVKLTILGNGNYLFSEAKRAKLGEGKGTEGETKVR